MQEVLKFLKENQTFYISTIEKDQPRVRPFGAITEFEGKLYLITSNSKPVYNQLKENPKFELCAMDNKGDWLRVAATAVFDTRREPKVKMLEDIPMLKTMYNPDDNLMEVFYMQDAQATFSSFTGERKVVHF